MDAAPFLISFGIYVVVQNAFLGYIVWGILVSIIKVRVLLAPGVGYVEPLNAAGRATLLWVIEYSFVGRIFDSSFQLPARRRPQIAETKIESNQSTIRNTQYAKNCCLSCSSLSCDLVYGIIVLL
jgi:hypothetical protein